MLNLDYKGIEVYYSKGLSEDEVKGYVDEESDGDKKNELWKIIITFAGDDNGSVLIEPFYDCIKRVRRITGSEAHTKI